MATSRHPSGGIGTLWSAVRHGRVPTTPPAGRAPAARTTTAHGAGGGAPDADVDAGDADHGADHDAPGHGSHEPKKSLYGKAVNWVEEPPYLFARLFRACLIFLGVIVGLRWGIALAMKALAYTFRPVTNVVGGFWGEPWLLVVLFVVGLFGTRIAAWAWKGLFKTHATPLDGADGFMGKVRKEYQNAFIVGIFIAVGVFYLLDPRVQTSILGNWVPERFWALGNLAVLTQTTLVFLVLFIWSRKIKGTILKYMLVLVTGLGFFISLERLAHLGVGRCPRTLHWVYVSVDQFTDINNLEGEVSVDGWQDRLRKSRKSPSANTIGYLPEDTKPHILWYTQFPNHGMIWPEDSLKGEFLIPAGAPLAANGIEEVLAKATVEVVVSKDLSTVVVVDTLRVGNVGESDFNWRFGARGIWNKVDAAGHADWRSRGAILGFRLVERDQFVNVVISEIVAYH